MKANEPPVYLQTWPTTCSVSCMMMAFGYFFGDVLSRRVESDLRHDLKMRGYDIVPAINIALHMRRRGLDVTVRHDSPHKFWKIMESFPEDFAAQMRERHDFAASRGMSILTGEVTEAEIKSRLSDGELIILGIDLGSVKHAILLHRIDGERVACVDPLSGRHLDTLDNLLARARMDVGTWYIAARCRDAHQVHHENETRP